MRLSGTPGFAKVNKPNLIMADLKSLPQPELPNARKPVLVTMADGHTELLLRAVGS
jgi:hypothetical protein